MIRLIFAILCWFLGSFVMGQSGLIITREHAVQDLGIVEKALFELHPGLDRYSNSQLIKKKLEQLKNQLFGSIDCLEFYRKLALIVAGVNCGHTIIKPGAEWTEDLQKNGRFFPLSVFVLDSSLYIRANGSTNPKLSKGDEILSINGIASTQIIQQLYDYLPSDGQNNSGIRNFLNKDLFVFNSYFHLLIDQAPTFEVRIKKQGTKPPFVTNIKAVNPGIFRYNLQNKMKSPFGESLNWSGNVGPKHNFNFIDSLATGVLTLRKFDDLKNLKLFLKQTFKDLKKNKASHLILDLRGNPGGLDEVGRILFTYLINRPLPYVESIETKTDNIPSELSAFALHDNSFLEHLEKKVDPITSGSTPKFALRKEVSDVIGVQRPKSHAFQGKLIVLVDGGTDSAAAALAHLLYENNIGILIGEKTGAAYQGGHSFTFLQLLLPNSQFVFQVPIMKYQLSVQKNKFPKDGALPHISIDYGIQDLLSEKDVVFEKAMDLIEGK